MTGETPAQLYHIERGCCDGSDIPSCFAKRMQEKINERSEFGKFSTPARKKSAIFVDGLGKDW